MNIHVSSLILADVARRVKYDPELMRNAVASEVPKILTTKTPTQRDLRARTNSAYIVTPEGFFFADRADVKHIRDAMFSQQSYDEVQDIRGLSACLGRAVGTVKVVGSVKEIAKVQTGDILVAVMTRPDYISAMKKAAAIVTDEGGITSHAAIVSRELGIPCLIGTKIATKVFKDGDLVEVNSNHGWVRKVQR